MGWRLLIVGFEPDKKMILSFFGGGQGRGDRVVGGDRGSWAEARDGRGIGGRGRASTHGAFSWWVGGCKSSVLNPTKK